MNAFKHLFSQNALPALNCDSFISSFPWGVVSFIHITTYAIIQFWVFNILELQMVQILEWSFLLSHIFLNRIRWTGS